MNDVLRIARLKIAPQRAFLGRAIMIFTLRFACINRGVGALNHFQDGSALTESYRNLFA